MSGKIHFVSGKEIEITEAEFRAIAPQLNSRGVKTKTLRAGHLLPLNSTTMEFIEHVPEEEILIEVKEKPKPMMHGEDAILEPMIPKENKPKTADEQLAEMIEKSNCKHEPEKQELFVQHTAKGIRYFPVCSFCGKRDRYISEKKIIEGAYVGTPNEKWTKDHVDNAKPWLEE